MKLRKNLQSKITKIFKSVVTATMILSSAVIVPINAEKNDEQYNQALIPLPVLQESRNGTFTLKKDTKIYVTTATKKAGEYLANKLRGATGYSFDVIIGTSGGSGNINIQQADNNAQGEEGYTLDVTTQEVSIIANQPAGAFRAVQTLRQMLPPEIEKGEIVQNGNWQIPCTHVEDKPEYAYRGSHLDVSRHFFTVDEVKSYIDNMAQYKMNKLHLHLTDDQGWRLEIKGSMYGEDLSKLNTIGAQTSTSINGIKAGQYSQEDFKEIVAYAADRYIEVIPEFDMPGHSWAALVSLNFLNSSEDGKPHSGNYDNTKPYEGVDVGFSSFECRNEKTYEFIEEVFKQVAAISPSKYIHIGGDEAHSTSTEDYVYFMNRVTQIAQKYNKIPIGWQNYDNVVEDKANSITQFWSTGDAKMKDGIKYILSPADHAYMDMKYDADCELGLQWAGLNSIKDTYCWEPENYGLKENIIGIEACLWSETLGNIEAVEYLAYPKILSHAEVGWTPKELRNWDEYKPRLIEHGKRLEYQGINFFKDKSIWLPDPVNGEWNFDEGQGNTVTDTKGLYPGKVKGTKWCEGVNGKALEFTGRSYVDLGLDDLNGAWSVALWVNKAISPENNAVLLSGSQGEIKLEQYNNTGKVGITEFGVKDHVFNYSVPKDKWTHLAFVCDGSKTTLYVNGEKVETLATAIKGPAKRIGANDKAGLESAGYLAGKLDEVKILNRVLSVNEIAAMAGVEVPEQPNNDTAPLAYGPTPSKRQLEYSKDERAAFIHFGVNTFNDVEWGDGKEDPAIFNPTKLDPEQWARILKESGFKKVIITAKHHDGFNLFDSPGTDHDITNSAINEAIRGRDVVKELSEACRKYGLKFGIYYSPWDQNSEHYGNDRGEDYNEYFMTALNKLLTEYGEISEVWFDGAKGSNVDQTYYFDQWFALVKEKQPNALIFSDMGPDVRWIGNEAGKSGEPCWSKIKGDTLTLPHYDTDYLNHGDPHGTHWIMPEADTSIRKGWFYHADQETKSLEKLVDIYFNSVGKNATLLLNVPPNKEGLIDKKDEVRLREFNAVIENSFKTNLASNSNVEASDYRGASLGVKRFEPSNVTDGNYDTYWTTDNGMFTGSLTIDLKEAKTFDVISIQEYIPLGQRIESFSVEVYDENLGEWKEVSRGQTIGYKRLVRLAPMTAQKIRINILSSQEVPLINNVEVYKVDPRIELESSAIEGLRVIDDQDEGTGINQIEYTGTWDDRETEEGFTNNSSHWSDSAGAKAKLRFKGSKFYFVSATHPNHGTFEVTIDGGEPFILDTYAKENFNLKQIVYESGELKYGDHVVELKVTGNNPHGGNVGVHIDAFYVLDNEKGLIEMDEDEIIVDEDSGKAQIPIRRIGGSKGKATVSFSLLSVTAVEGKDFQRMIEDVDFEEGQTEAFAEVVLFDNDEMDGSRYFTVTINNVVGGTLGRKKTTIVNINDDDTGYTPKKPFVFPSEVNDTKLLEAEHFELVPISGEAYVRVEDDSSCSNGQKVNWFEEGNVIQVDYNAPKAGKYIVKATYASGREEGTNNPNRFNWSGEKIVSGSKDVYGTGGATFYTTEFEIEVTEAGTGKLIFTADSNAGPVIDKFEIIAKEFVAETEVDKTALLIAINTAKAVTPEQLDRVIAVVKSEFERAFANAQAIYDNNSATQGDVCKAFMHLAKTLQMLEFVKGDVAGLQGLVNEYSGLDAKNYTSDSFAKLQAALDSAKEVLLAGENALEVDVNKAKADLEIAYKELVPAVEVDKSKLQAFYNQVKGTKEDKYLPNTWIGFEKALNDAEVVLANTKATQDEVDNAYNKLVKAYLDLRLVPNKDALKNLIDKAESLNNPKLAKAIAQAKAVIVDENATEAQVNGAYAKLEAAIKGLDTGDKVVANDDKAMDTGDNNAMASMMVFAGLSIVGLYLSKKEI